MRTSNQLLATNLGTVLLASALLTFVGCQDSGAGGFREYSDTEEIPALPRDEPLRDDPPRAVSADGGATLVVADQGTHETPAGQPDTDTPDNSTAANAAAVEQRDDPSTDNASTDETDRAGNGGTQASAVSVRSEAFAEMARQREATLAASAGNPAVAGSVPMAGATETEPATTEPREIKLLVEQQRFRPEGDSKALRVSYDDIDLLKVLNMEPVPIDAVDYFPDWLNGLDGQRIRIRGFMFPTFKATGLKAFLLARDNDICCFGRQPKIYDVFEVYLADDETTDYIEGKPFDVEGTFHIAPEADDTDLYQLYRIDDAKVLR